MATRHQMRIKEFARLVERSTERVRQWELEGKIDKPLRVFGCRVYTEKHLAQARAFLAKQQPKTT